MQRAAGGGGDSLGALMIRQLYTWLWVMSAGNWHSNQGVLDANTVPVINPDGVAAADQVCLPPLPHVV